MALHCRPKRPVFRTKLLPAFAKRVYCEMFAPSAPHSTTHALSREYARRIVDVARCYTPGSLKRDQRARVVPPFKDSGVSDWPVMEDPNEGKYRGALLDLLEKRKVSRAAPPP